MKYYCDISEKIIKNNSKRKYIQSLTDDEIENCIRIKQTFQNPEIFMIDETYNENITNHKKYHFISCFL